MKNKNKAFTLIELMVAMAIIGILAGVVLVSMSGYAKRARETAALQTAASVMPAAIKCALESKTMSTPPSSDGGGPICAGSSFTWPILNTSSTKGWVWVEASGDSSNPNGYWYVLCGPNSNCDAGQQYIGCSVTDNANDWPGGIVIQPGTCVSGVL